MTLDHIGIAIDQPALIALFESLLGTAPYKTEAVEREGVQTIFFGDGGTPGVAPKLELLEATRDGSPIARHLDRRGPGLHHLAFEVDDIERHIERVRALGIRPLADAPKPGADGKRIVFLHPKDTAGVLVELVESVRQPPRWVEVDGPAGPLAVQVSGPADGPPLLVLHGALGSTELETDRLIQRWESRFRVFGLDLRGHGRSVGTTARGATWEDNAQDAITALGQLAGAPSALFGFSMGAGVALAVAARRPDLVSRLAVHGVNVQWTDAEVQGMVGPMRDIEADHPFWARRLAEIHGPRWRDLVADVTAFTEALPDHHILDADLARISAPTLVSHGDSDRFFDVRHAVHTYRQIADARLYVIPGLDHPIQGLDVASFAQTVGDFLSDP